MNIEEIKRNIRYGAVPKENNNKISQSVKEAVKPVELRNEEKHIKRFTQPDEEEEKKPNSEVWEDDGFVLNVGKSVEMIINSLELEDEVYDWRRETKKGKRSRKNFTDFLVENL